MTGAERQRRYRQRKLLKWYVDVKNEKKRQIRIRQLEEARDALKSALTNFESKKQQKQEISASNDFELMVPKQEQTEEQLECHDDNLDLLVPIRVEIPTDLRLNEEQPQIEIKQENVEDSAEWLKRFSRDMPADIQIMRKKTPMSSTERVRIYRKRKALKKLENPELLSKSQMDAQNCLKELKLREKAKEIVKLVIQMQNPADDKNEVLLPPRYVNEIDPALKPNSFEIPSDGRFHIKLADTKKNRQHKIVRVVPQKNGGETHILVQNSSTNFMNNQEEESEFILGL